MYNPGMMDKVSDEQNRRIREQQAIAQSWNQVEHRPEVDGALSVVSV